MADNIELDSGTGGATIATDDDGTAHHQYVKVEFGGDGTFTKVEAAVGLPVAIITLPSGNLGMRAMAASLSVVPASDITDATYIGDIKFGEALPTGSNTIGKLAANSGVDIGDVDVKTVGSVVDANNSTTSTLGGGASFTGDSTDLLGYSAVCITLYADVDSAADGMSFEFSSDGTNWDDVYEFTLDNSESPTRRFQFPVTARYFRLVYTNGGGAQSTFRVQTILHTANQLTSIHRISDDMSPDRSAQVMKTALFARKAGTGDLTLIDATAGGNLKISVQEVSDGLDIGAGNAGSETIRVSISTNDVNLSAIKTATELLDNTVVVLGTATYTETSTSGNVVGAVRNDDLATLANTDNEIAPLQVDSQGALYVNQGQAEGLQASGVAAGGTPGADVMIAAVGSRYLKITALSLFATSTTTNTIYVDNVDNMLLGDASNGIALSLDADGDTVAGFILPYNPAGWFKTDAVNEAVTLNTSSAQDIIWCISYEEVA